MSLSHQIKRLASFIPFVKVDLGYHISSHDALTIPGALSVEDVERSTLKRGAYFKLKNIHQPFEFVSFVKGNDGKVLVQLKHKYTGELLTIPRNVFDLLFESF